MFFGHFKLGCSSTGTARQAHHQQQVQLPTNLQLPLPVLPCCRTVIQGFLYL
jgi:hypothetical protein